MKRAAFLSLVVIASMLVVQAQDADPNIALLKKEGIPLTAAGIIKHLDAISPTPDMIANVDRLIAQLGADSFRDRRAAQKKLQALGQLAEAKVTAATKSSDPEIRDRARRIVASYNNYDAEAVLLACLAHLPKTNAGGGGVEAVLKAAPLYFGPYVLSTAETALTQLARPDDLPLLLRVSNDPKSPARLLAVVAAAKLLGPEQTDQLQALLQDKDIQMRLATARAIANVGDRRAIAAFLQLMTHKDAGVRQRGFSCLQQFTQLAMGFPAYGKEAERALALKNWRAWAEGEGKTAKLHFPLGRGLGGNFLYGNTLLTMGNNGGGVVELDRDKNEIWRYAYQNCWTAEKLANGNYLMGSYSEEKVVEVNRAKKVVWEFPTKAMGVTQLANGNVLAATYSSNSVIEIDKRTKKIVWQYNAGVNCYKAIRLPNGNTLVAGFRFIREITKAKKVVWEYKQGQYFYTLQTLANGNLWVGEYSGVAYELTRDKKRVGERKFGNNTCVYRLRNGNVLVAEDAGIKEYDKDNKVVWSFKGNSLGSARR